MLIEKKKLSAIVFNLKFNLKLKINLSIEYELSPLLIRYVKCFKLYFKILIAAIEKYKKL